MPSEISKTIKAYQRALDESRTRYEALYTSRGENALDFYRKDASRLMRDYSKSFNDVATRRRLHREIRRLFGVEAR